MAQYLDASGLQEFWDGIKPKIAAKQDKLTAGTNITISASNVISATGGGSVTVDSALSSSSTNPVQNKVIKSALDGKVNTESGKGLSTNDFTTTEKNKLAGIATGAEVNVQADWDEADSSNDAYIKNKPTIPTQITVDSAISSSSTNPVENQAIYTALNGKQGTLTAGTGISISATNVISATGGGGGVTVDDTLSDSSENPVQNKVIKSALDGKQGTLTAGTGIDISSNTISQAATESVTITINTSNVGSGKATTAATVTVVKSGRLVNVYATWTLGSGALSSWTTIASGLPVPAIAPIYNAVPSYNSSSVACNVGITAAGQFNVRYGTANRVYYMNMCYLTA